MDVLDEVEQRVVGCLVEKEATVPDSYPMTLKGLRTACNQSTSRDPVVTFDEATVQAALDRLKPAGFVRFVHPSHGERSTRFRHVVGEKLGLDAPELAVVSVLLLRGPQTPTELRARTERQHAFTSLGEVESVLRALAARAAPLVSELPRQPGQQHARWAHLLAGEVDVEALSLAAQASEASASGGRSGSNSTLSASAAARIEALESQVVRLTERLARLEAELGVGSEDRRFSG